MQLIQLIQPQHNWPLLTWYLWTEMLYRIAGINPMNGRLQQKSSPIDTYWTIVWAICIIRASKGRPTDISPLETLGHGVKSGGALWGNGCPSDDVKCCLVRFDGMVNTDFHAIKLPTSPLQLALQITMLACFLTEQLILYNTPRKINILNPTMQVFGSDEIPAISVAPPHLPSLQSCCLTNWPNCLSLPTRKDGACEPWNGIFFGTEKPCELWPFAKTVRCQNRWWKSWQKNKKCGFWLGGFFWSDTPKMEKTWRSISLQQKKHGSNKSKHCQWNDNCSKRSSKKGDWHAGAQG